MIGPGGLTLPIPRAYSVVFLNSVRESPTVSTFRFSTEGLGFRYLSNQAIRLSLPGVDDPWGAVRSFSLSSSPSERDVIAVTCKITDTPFKQALARLRPGETAQAYGPLGAFRLDPSRPSVFLAGGVGISPFRGMMRYALDTRLTQPVRLLYSARTAEELVFRAEIDEMAGRHPDLVARYTVTRPTESAAGWTGRVGRIDPAWVEEAIVGLTRPKYYVAGLPEMVADSVRLLQSRFAVPEDDLDYEVFRGY